MFDLSQARLTKAIVHFVGNKLKTEGFLLDPEALDLSNDLLKDHLQDFFLASFKRDQFYKFKEVAINDANVVYEICRMVFTKALMLEPASHDLAEHLYRCNLHPHIKSGELYMAHFRECELDGVIVEAIGIFKSETKEPFFKMDFNAEFNDETVTLHKGIPTNKLDKGCILFNTMEEDGYTILMVDRNSEDTAYWRDDFLQVERIQDSSYQTEHFLKMTNDFCDEVLAAEKDRRDQVIFLNRAINYFGKRKEFDLDEFKSNVVEPQHRKRFEEYRSDYETDTGLPNSDEGFAISRAAVSGMKKQFKSEMVLDTQVRIQLLSKDANEAGQYIERAFDKDRNMYFYKVYFNSELA